MANLSNRHTSASAPNRNTTANPSAQAITSPNAQCLALQLEDTLTLTMHKMGGLYSLLEAIKRLSKDDNYPQAMTDDLIGICQHLVMEYQCDASDDLDRLQACKEGGQ